jgi:hypothetical protein
MYATGVGSLPGTDSGESARIVAGELAEFIHLVELPNRGPGAELVGRAAGLVAHVVGEFGLDTTPQGWRIDSAGGRIMRRAWSWLAEDLDNLEATTIGYRGVLKVQICGPWTMAAAIESRTGARLVADPGACRDLTEALAEAVAWMCSEARRRVPSAASLFLQVDEPLLARVAEGSLETASGFMRHTPIVESTMTTGLTAVFDAAREGGATPGIHSCAPRTPWALIERAGAEFISVDFAAIPDEILGAYWERNAPILAGCVTPGIVVDGAHASLPVREAASRLGFVDRYGNISITPTCGLAGVDPGAVRQTYACCQAGQRVLRDEREDHE